ncbi:hypothetical protein Cthiooxydans_37280 [Comamonas thiooxydans]|nr:hypothetical protein Cthiooxydans_37280 [Comamonas thiooxydans]
MQTATGIHHDRRLRDAVLLTQGKKFFELLIWAQACQSWNLVSVKINEQEAYAHEVHKATRGGPELCLADPSVVAWVTFGKDETHRRDRITALLFCSIGRRFKY